MAINTAVGLIPMDDERGSGVAPVADVPRVVRQMDSPANRCVKAMVQALTRRCVQVSTELADRARKGAGSDTVTGIGQRLPRWQWDLARMRDQLKRLSRTAPLAAAARADITAAGLNAISAAPIYSRFWKSAWKSLRIGNDGDEQVDLLPLSPTWELYGRWCFVRLAQHLKSSTSDWTWKLDRPNLLLGMGPNKATASLELQPEFRSTNGMPNSGFWSVSGRPVPDIALSWCVEEQYGFLVLDAKYRVSRQNVLAAMQSAHLYRDALRRGHAPPMLSVVLVPVGGGAPWLEDWDFIRQHGVGAAVLSPGIESADWLTRVLEDCLTGRLDLTPS